MSVQLRQRTSSKRSEYFKKIDSSSEYNSYSTLQNDPVLEFQKMKECLHNLFQFAKKQIMQIYQIAIQQVTFIGANIKQNKKVSQQYIQQISTIKKQAQQAMLYLPQNLQNVLKVIKMLKMMNGRQRSESNQYCIAKINQQHRKKSVNSLNKNQSSSGSIQIGSRDFARKITTASVKSIETLQFLQGTWPKLELIHLQAKNLLNLCQFKYVCANLLSSMNLSNNLIHELSGFQGSNFPNLTHLNLSRNKIKLLQGLQQSKMPNLVILNLSKNSISQLQPLTKCQFNNLLQLHLQGNRIKNLQPLKQCTFANLQILNLDHNKIQNCLPLSDISFYRLKCLTFSNNEITSISFLSRMCLRRLQGLIGHNNKITQLQPLCDGTFPCLKQIILHSNQINDITCIKRMNFPQLTSFDLQFNKIKNKSVGCILTTDRGYRQARKKFPFILI